MRNMEKILFVILGIIKLYLFLTAIETTGVTSKTEDSTGVDTHADQFAMDEVRHKLALLANIQSILVFSCQITNSFS